MVFDLIITGGQVLDGKGNPPVKADVGLVGDRIESVGDLSAAEVREVVRAERKYVCPGFIDAHSHSDAYLLIEPSAASKVFQGITTEIVGQCGASAAPLKGAYKMPADWREKEYPGTWSTVAEYRGVLEGVRPAPNVVLLIGHNTIRAGTMGYKGCAASPRDIAAMKELLASCLEEGARGFSTGLLYEPGRHAEPGEIGELARIVAEHGGTYTSHMRSEGAHLLEAIDEVVEACRRSGVRTQIAHLKTSGRRNWDLLDAAIEKIEAARAEGLPVTADRYPYTAACTELDVVLPDWAREGGSDAVLARLRDEDARTRIRTEMVRSRDRQYWESVRVGSTYHPDNERWAGRPLLEVAEQLGLSPVDTVLTLIEKDVLKTGGIFFGMSEDNMWKILARPWVMLGTDASLRAPTGPLSHDHPHPRAYGSFPRFLRASLDGKTVSIEEAVRKMTSLPAGQFGLKDRGALEPGRFADIVVFDPESLRDKATYAEPHQLAKGVDALIVNGIVTIRDGKMTGDRGGRFLD